MHRKIRTGLAAFATTAAVTGAILTLAGTPAAIAAPAAAEGSAGVQALKWKGPYSEAECLTVQGEYRRYYKITIPCKYFASTGYYFEYDNGQ
ncbi:hypothetical protein [Kibdelosporangium aridum]|uniref:Uncharacterized protein n=1 Tax=Kibdelosporangium aridum TaxID=2030 RepID=A0A1Y5Y839_KIBAR|nr:hypothetical protein [Kibdelosporangium aridum]SMD26937.1 hypothetical protein SAMN05661093_10524 [Kibdelosporangium aridum]